MPKVVRLEYTKILGHVIRNMPAKAVMYDSKSGMVRWYGPNVERSLKERSVTQITQIHDFLHPQEAENWILEGELVLRTKRIQEYVQHVAWTETGYLSSRTFAWGEADRSGWKEELYYTHVSPASHRKSLVLRISLSLDRVLQLGEQYLQEQDTEATTLSRHL